MLKSIRILLSIAAYYDYEIWQMDVKTAFLNGHLEETIYMVQPEGFVVKNQEQKVCKLQRISIQGKELASQPIPNEGFGRGKLHSCIQMTRDRKNRLLALSQAVYIDKVLVKFAMENSKKGNLPSRHGVHLAKEPDICFAVGVVSRYQSNPGLDHWRLSEVYFWSIFTLGCGAIIWRSVKQTCVADSTMEAEYVAACEAAKEAVWLREFLKELEVVPNMHEPIRLYCDNSGAVANAKEPGTIAKENT
ncbi:Retrovirus-related Pol polyprotein from transposon TNT 1-94 [Vitis vinifera]|uniref:Retrovirus-related Pol polyprotein from transposon TNT 1-94 n=1 Tax=Vitis vinifera TaxID=29760 RepID=A0A438C8R6_VITVI|nr:Retrovirus-related Pol polyprotein from transposon TNT 1-94 [Vitis vinifera]